ncbi:hypothetical protein [Bradyrhizobium sp. S69]|jgi:hypothetical protein|uniref:hypothetical protein n=1 Tax=Bradyrhizobium sp. S69 TaxID=1641856 RepID=UPI00131CCF38|nr:hypothetical protein [Bradyrhizobium sp. S69]
MIFREKKRTPISGDDHVQELDPGKPDSGFANKITLNKRPAAIRPLGTTGKVPVRPERMDAIRNIKTMAGSPDADAVSASRNLAHGFCISSVRFFREPMKEDRNV